MMLELVTFRLDGVEVSTEVMPYQTAVEVLGSLGVRGPRMSCGLGMCGCCTIWVDGRVVSGCLLLGLFLDGTVVETVASLANDEALHPIQQAFIDQGAFQCGFCTSGWIMMIRQLLADFPDPTEEEIDHYLAGNACRCGAYPEIRAAVAQAIERSPHSDCP